VLVHPKVVVPIPDPPKLPFSWSFKSVSLYDGIVIGFGEEIIVPSSVDSGLISVSILNESDWVYAVSIAEIEKDQMTIGIDISKPNLMTLKNYDVNVLVAFVKPSDILS